MLTIRDHVTGDLFGPWGHLGEKRRRLLDRSWAAVFRDHLLAHLPVAELASRFSRELGRPTKDLHAVVGALILQQLHDTTDAATVEAIALNVAWQYALDIRAESDTYLCERTLRSYRRLLIERGLDRVLFRTLTDRLISAIGVDTTRQRLDSTAIRSAMRGLTRLGIVVEAIAKFLRELRRLHPGLHARVVHETIRKYVDRVGTAASARPGRASRGVVCPRPPPTCSSWSRSSAIPRRWGWRVTGSWPASWPSNARSSPIPKPGRRCGSRRPRR